jgi:16S rRNA (cytidine1402-2'-O)-methyltransferase
MDATGRLAIVATPIGNLRDITLRALDVLRDADLVCAEDTRTTGHLLDAHGVRAKALMSLHEHNEAARTEVVLARIRAGETVALASDAGTPLVSDPGFELVRAAVAEGLRVEAIPGPCAAIAALVSSGLPPEPFTFAGFAPKKPARARAWLNDRLRPPGTFILYVPARDAQELVALIAERWPAAPVVLARELTKLHETCHRALAADFALPEEARRGEAALVVHLAEQPDEERARADVARDLEDLVTRGLSRRDAILAVSALRGIPKADVARVAHGHDS